MCLSLLMFILSRFSWCNSIALNSFRRLMFSLSNFDRRLYYLVKLTFTFTYNSRQFAIQSLEILHNLSRLIQVFHAPNLNVLIILQMLSPEVEVLQLDFSILKLGTQLRLTKFLSIIAYRSGTYFICLPSQLLFIEFH